MSKCYNLSYTHTMKYYTMVKMNKLEINASSSLNITSLGEIKTKSNGFQTFLYVLTHAKEDYLYTQQQNRFEPRVTYPESPGHKFP